MKTGEYWIRVTEKLNHCIESAVTKEHFLANENMINRVIKLAKGQPVTDQGLLGVLYHLRWFNFNRGCRMFNLVD